MHTERQTQILKVSMELIASKGIQGFTIKNLSKEIGISEPAIYRHFENKTAILVTILDDFKALVGSSSNTLIASDKTAIVKLQLMFSKMLDRFIDQPAIVSVLFSEEIFKNEVILKEKILQIQNANQERVEHIIEQGQLNNNVRKDIDKSTFALMFMGAFRLLVKRWDLNDYNSDLKVEGQKLLNSFHLFIQ